MRASRAGSGAGAVHLGAPVLCTLRHAVPLFYGGAHTVGCNGALCILTWQAARRHSCCLHSCALGSLFAVGLSLRVAGPCFAAHFRECSLKQQPRMGTTVRCLSTWFSCMEQL